MSASVCVSALQSHISRIIADRRCKTASGVYKLGENRRAKKDRGGNERGAKWKLIGVMEERRIEPCQLD